LTAVSKSPVVAGLAVSSGGVLTDGSDDACCAGSLAPPPEQPARDRAKIRMAALMKRVMGVHARSDLAVRAWHP
jgi:hypothetical protein